MEEVIRGVDRCVCWRKAKACRRWPAIFDFDALNLVAHATVGVLSQKRAMCLY